MAQACGTKVADVGSFLRKKRLKTKYVATVCFYRSDLLRTGASQWLIVSTVNCGWPLTFFFFLAVCLCLSRGRLPVRCRRSHRIVQSTRLPWCWPSWAWACPTTVPNRWRRRSRPSRRPDETWLLWTCHMITDEPMRSEGDGARKAGSTTVSSRTALFPPHTHTQTPNFWYPSLTMCGHFRASVLGTLRGWWGTAHLGGGCGTDRVYVTGFGWGIKTSWVPTGSDHQSLQRYMPAICRQYCSVQQKGEKNWWFFFIFCQSSKHGQIIWTVMPFKGRLSVAEMYLVLKWWQTQNMVRLQGDETCCFFVFFLSAEPVNRSRAVLAYCQNIYLWNATVRRPELKWKIFAQNLKCF